jgi:hypothetical protein
MIKGIRKVMHALDPRRIKERRARRIAEEAAAQERFIARRIAEDVAAREEAVARLQREESERTARLAAEQERGKAAELAQAVAHEQERARREAELQQAIAEEEAYQRRIGNPFLVGGRYQNRKGFYTVLAISGDELRIRWDSGQEITCSAAEQRRILWNMHTDRPRRVWDAYYGEPPDTGPPGKNPATRERTVRPRAINRWPEANENAGHPFTDEYIKSGTGHYGRSQIGGSRPVMRSVHNCQAHETLEAKLRDRGILVKVQAVETSSATGGLTAIVFGEEPHVQAAIDFCQALTPCIEVRRRLTRL